MVCRANGKVCANELHSRGAAQELGMKLLAALEHRLVPNSRLRNLGLSECVAVEGLEVMSEHLETYDCGCYEFPPAIAEKPTGWHDIPGESID